MISRIIEDEVGVIGLPRPRLFWISQKPNLIFVLLYIERKKISHVFASSLTASNTKRACNCSACGFAIFFFQLNFNKLLVYPKSPTEIVEITYGIIISGNFQDTIVQKILMCQKKSQQRGRG